MAATEYILGSSYSQRKSCLAHPAVRPCRDCFVPFISVSSMRNLPSWRGGTISWPVMDDYRETIWGINPKDRRWFQLLTLIGGTAGSVILTQLEVSDGGVASSQAARNIVLGIGASFVASGFISWALLQAKELIMAIADWIRQDAARRKAAHEERQERLIQEAIQQGRQEGYVQGYADAQQGKPKQPPGDGPAKSP